MKALYLIVPFAPLVGAIVAGLFGKQIGRAGAHSVTILGELPSRHAGEAHELSDVRREDRVRLVSMPSEPKEKG